MKELDKEVKSLRKKYKRLTKGNSVRILLQPWPTVEIKTTISWQEDNYATADENAISEQIIKATNKYRDALYLEYFPQCEPFIREMNVEIRALIDKNNKLAKKHNIDEDKLWDKVIDI